jgi:hypothetical protein
MYRIAEYPKPTHNTTLAVIRTIELPFRRKTLDGSLGIGGFVVVDVGLFSALHLDRVRAR